MNSTLQIRIDKQTKEKAGKIFRKMGIDTSSGIKMFLSQVVHTGAIPFTPTTQNGFSKKREREIIAETKAAIRAGKRYRDIRMRTPIS
ncbi:MAG: type II toxin-antitoxin system RelB/DinJ family antitoxin [Patescibacteria group bacterium]